MLLKDTPDHLEEEGAWETPPPPLDPDILLAWDGRGGGFDVGGGGERFLFRPDELSPPDPMPAGGERERGETEILYSVFPFCKELPLCVLLKCELLLLSVPGGLR